MNLLHNVHNIWNLLFFYCLLVVPLNKEQTELCEGVAAAAACQSLMVRSGRSGNPGHLRLLPHNEYDEDG